MTLAVTQEWEIDGYIRNHAARVPVLSGSVMATNDQSQRISIVMPSYNQVVYLEESILSILEQDHPDVEFIVLDGGSTDGSLAILEKYASHFTYWHSRPDRGQIDALIQGFKLSTGNLLGWVNSDDVLLPGALSALAKAHSRRPSAGLIGGKYLLIDENGKVIRCKRHPTQASWFARNGLVAINQPGSLFTREAFDRVGGFDPSLDWVMDTDLYYRILASGFSYTHVNRWLSAFRIHSRAKTSAQRDRRDSEGRHAMASWFPHERCYRARFAITLVAYQLWQVANGNHLRASLETTAARGSDWKSWAADHCPTELLASSEKPDGVDAIG
jgi:GT2 family glycosyltransferase